MANKYTSDQLLFLKDGFKEMQVPELTVAFNVRFGLMKNENQIRSTLKNHRFRSGRTGQFKKGQSGWNAGTKGLVKPNSGNFEKGSIPANIKQLGHERIDKKDGFILIKVAEPNPYTRAATRYRHKHVWLWEQAHGPVPKGKVVAFIDGDKLNCITDNLMLITRAELMHLNRLKYSETPDELKPTVLALAKVEVKTFDAQRNGK